MKKELNIVTLSILSIVFLLLIGYALADLPIQGNHDGTWGTHLNDWLNLGHNTATGQVDNLSSAIDVNATGLRVGNSSATAALNITGIFINTTGYDLGPISYGLCERVGIPMAGLPGNATCFASIDLPVGAEGNGSIQGNLTVTGMTSNQSNGRILVCAAGTNGTTGGTGGGGVAGTLNLDLPRINFTAMCITPRL